MPKKNVLIVVGGILVLVAILAAVSIGVIVSKNEKKDMDMVMLSMEDKFKAEIMSDMKTNRVHYYIGDRSFRSYEAWVEDSLDQGIRVMKLKTNSSDMTCYVTPLNCSSMANASQMNHFAKMDDMTIPSNYSYEEDIKPYIELYVIAGSPITDLSFLSKSVRDMCNGQSVYWIFPGCRDGLGNRRRRKRFLAELVIGVVSAIIGSFSSCVFNDSGKCVGSLGKCFLRIIRRCR